MIGYNDLHILLDKGLRTMTPGNKEDFLRAIINTLYEHEYDQDYYRIISYLITTGRMFESGRVSKESEGK